MVNNPQNAEQEKNPLDIKGIIRKCEDQLEKLQITLSRMCWIITILSVITFIAGIILFACFYYRGTPVTTTTTTITDTTTTATIIDTGLKFYIPAGLAVVLLVALFLYNPVKQIRNTFAHMSQTTLAISGFKIEVYLQLARIGLKTETSPNEVKKAIEKVEKAIDKGQISSDKVEKAIEKLEEAIDGEQKAIDEAIEHINSKVENYINLIQECIEEA